MPLKERWLLRDDAGCPVGEVSSSPPLTHPLRHVWHKPWSERF